jgi:tRNA G10  N-methylase Trm11
MSGYIFIHGKNPELSIAEVMSLSGAKPTEANREFSVFDIFETADFMGRLGGTLKVAEVLSILEMDAGWEHIEAAIRRHYPKLMQGFTGSNLLFGVTFYGGKADKERIEFLIKGIAKEEGLRVSAAHAKRRGLTHTEVVNKHIMGRGFELMLCMGKRLYIAKTVFVHDPYEFRKRDLQRPAQRTIYSIPPRLARIMINLTGVRRNELLMDPFCGIGTIISEAALMGMRVTGIDTNHHCVTAARKNMKWLSRQYGLHYPGMENMIRSEDARWLSKHFREKSVDAMATEPYMGPPMRSRPDRVRALKILSDLKQLYEHSLAEMLKVLKPGRRICMVSPSFMVAGHLYGLGMAEMAGRHGGKVINPLANSGFSHKLPLMDYEDRHNTLREISVIEKTA